MQTEAYATTAAMTEIPEGRRQQRRSRKRNCLNRRSRLHAMRCLLAAALAQHWSLIMCAGPIRRGIDDLTGKTAAEKAAKDAQEKADKELRPNKTS